jgi:uncharacterized protein (TIRG00374 family)
MEGKKKKLFSRANLIFYFFSVIVFALGVYYFSDIKKDIKLLRNVNLGWLGIAILAQVCTYFLGAVIYYDLLRAFKVKKPPGLGQLLQANVAALFLNQAVPIAGLSGSTFFFNFLVKRNIAVSYILPLIVIELLAFYAAMEIIILFAATACLFLQKAPLLFFGFFAGGFLAYFLFGFLIAVIGRQKTLKTLYKKLTGLKFIRKWLQRREASFPGKTELNEIKTPERIFLEHKATILKTVGWQVCIFLADAFTIFALFYGLSAPVSIITVIVVLICSKIISLLPFLPGSLILYEGGMTFFFVSLGVPFNTAVIVTLLYRILSFWLPIPVGLFIYRKLQVGHG